MEGTATGNKLSCQIGGQEIRLFSADTEINTGKGQGVYLENIYKCTTENEAGDLKVGSLEGKTN